MEMPLNFFLFVNVQKWAEMFCPLQSLLSMALQG